jgi:EAL domain-containing protein (putative c-di-GMP-specific phosphodiesterase class I)/ActR/RegA family two-component response regulator
MNLSASTTLQQAIVRGELLLEYQPFVDVRTHQAAGAEALVRWRHPVEGVLRPERFIPQSEENGLIVEVGRWVLREACRERARWREAGVVAGPMAVNVSAHELGHPGYVDAVLAALADAELGPQLLELEITESAFIASFERVRGTVRELREIGIGMALDDFGTGYSFLRSLRSVDVDQLKIPIDFICGVGEDPDCDAIIDAMLALGHRLGLTIVAEGVETAEQLELLRARGCDLAQGNFLCPPAPASEALRWIEGRLAVTGSPAPRAYRAAAARNGGDGPIRVMVVDDHDLTRRTIVRVLRQADDVEVVGEAADGVEALATLRGMPADVVLLDVSMPIMGGLETLRELRALRPELGLLILSMHPEDPYALRFLREGAHGYMNKERAGDELIGALRTVHAGRRYASRALLDKLAATR